MLKNKFKRLFIHFEMNMKFFDLSMTFIKYGDVIIE